MGRRQKYKDCSSRLAQAFRQDPVSKTMQARLQWLMSVILVIQEAEIRRITVQSQPKANSLRDPVLKKLITKKG
jgi:predicted secreted acid phosphatase